MNKKLLLVFILAFSIRLISLNQSLWLDEATTAQVIKNYSFFRIITTFSLTDFHPPLYYLFMRLWSLIFGYSEITLRLPSVIFSILTGYFIYKIGKLIKSESVGFWSALFFLFNPLIIYYSQEARMYSFVTLFLTISLYYLLSKHIFRLNIFIVLSLLTYYGSIFIIVCYIFYFLYKKKYQFFIVSLVSFLLILIILFPLLSQQLAYSRVMLSLIINWGAVLGRANLKSLLLIPLKFSIGRISFYPKSIYYLISGMWTTLIFYYLIKGGLKNKLLLFFFTAPLLLGILFSFYSPLLQYFRFLYLITIMSLLLSLGTSHITPRPPAMHYHKALRASRWILAGFVGLSMIYLLIPKFHREDWQSLARNLPKKSTIYVLPSSQDPLNYYRHDLKLVDIRNDNTYLSNKNELIIIPYVADIYGFDYQKILKDKGFFLKERIIFRDLTVERW